MTREALAGRIPERETEHGAGGSRLAGVLTVTVFTALSIAAGISSRGFLEADGCTHYLYARFALHEPHFLVNVWGRPLFTVLYAIPSAFAGLTGARLLSLVLALLCGAIAYTIARGQRYRWPVLALVFTLGQPLLFLHSFSELTELPFAALVGLAFIAYQRKRWLALSIAAGLAPLGRPEGFGFVLLALIALLVHRRMRWIFVLPIPVLIWNHVGWTLSGGQGPWWEWLVSNWPYSQDSLYPRGNPLHFVALLPAITSPFVFPATLVGLWRSFAQLDGLNPHGRACRQLIALIPLMILFVHSALYATGKLSSSGELRYLLIVAPFWGLLSARGWEWVFVRLEWRHPLAWAGAAALAAGLANAVYPVLPLNPTEDYTRSERFIEWYRTSGAEEDFPRVCTAQMCIYYFMDVSPTDPDRALEYRRDLITAPPPGTILVFDPIYAIYNADGRRSVSYDELLRHGWREAPDTFPDFGGGWKVLLSPRDDQAGR